jgi:hypothetical protein
VYVKKNFREHFHTNWHEVYWKTRQDESRLMLASPCKKYESHAGVILDRGHVEKYSTVADPLQPE